MFEPNFPYCVVPKENITYLYHFKCTLTSLSFSLLLFVPVSPSALVYFSVPVRSPDMQICFSNCETAAK